MVKRDFDEGFAERCEIMNRRHKVRSCPGCGNLYHLPAQKLCGACAKELKLGHKRMGELESMNERAEKALVTVGTTFMHSLPSGCWPSTYQNVGYHDFMRALERLLGEGDPAEMDLDYFEAQRVKSDHFFYVDKRRYKGTTVRFWMSKDKVDDLKLVLDFVARYFGEIYKLAIRKGKNLLFQLAESGVDELNKVTIQDKNAGRK